MTFKIYYNEIEPYAIEWLRNLMRAGLIAPGDIDTRPIQDVRPIDVSGYTQCHFFAGIGGWSLALRRAAWPDHRPVWTGSCPCQPFSAAGRRRGFADDRHLWPFWHWLVGQCAPSVVLGEQVAGAADWLRLVRGDLEALDYAVGAIPVEAASAGADHLRDRFWFVAHDKHAREGRWRLQRSGESSPPGGERAPVEFAGSNTGIDVAHHQGDGWREGWSQSEIRSGWPAAAGDGRAIGFNMADDDDARSQGQHLSAQCSDQRFARPDGMASVAHGDAEGIGLFGRSHHQDGGRGQQPSRSSGEAGVGLADTDQSQRRFGDEQPSRQFPQHEPDPGARFGHDMADCFGAGIPDQRSGATAAAPGEMQANREERQRFWTDTGECSDTFEWVTGADGKIRRVKSGIRLLVDGVSGRVAVRRAGEQGNTEEHWYNRIGALQGFGNAIDPRPAQAFIESVMELLVETIARDQLFSAVLDQ